MFVRVQLTYMNEHCVEQATNHCMSQWWPVKQCMIYASLDLNELNTISQKLSKIDIHRNIVRCKLRSVFTVSADGLRGKDRARGGDGGQDPYPRDSTPQPCPFFSPLSPPPPPPHFLPFLPPPPPKKKKKKNPPHPFVVLRPSDW